jgi:DNA-binding transcriptional regulator YdaS (Cro superfamily)
MDQGLAKAIIAVKTRAELAERLGITPGAISQWDKIPINRVTDVERVTGVPREQLRPDIYGPR